MEYKKLNELCEINIGKTPSRNKSEYWGEGSSWLSISDLKDKFITKTKEEITSMAISACNMKIVPKDTVVMSFKLSIGKTAILKEDMYTNEAIANFPIKNNSLIPEYLYYAIKTLNFDNTDRAVMGATLNKAKLNELRIPYCEINKQKEIVEVLNKSQELIDKRKKQIEELDELVKSQFIEMFGDTFLNTKNFEMKQIRDIVTVVKGITYKPEQVNDEGTIVLRSSNIKGNKFDLNDIVRVNKKIDEKFLVEVNDILMCNRNGSERLVGKVAKIPEYSEPMTFGTFMTIVRSPYHNYLFNFFQTEAFRRQIKMQTSVAINQISIPLLESVKVPLPPIELQNQFAHFVKHTDKLKFEMEKSLKELEDNFNSLMQKAFKGELFN